MRLEQKFDFVTRRNDANVLCPEAPGIHVTFKRVNGERWIDVYMDWGTYRCTCALTINGELCLRGIQMFSVAQVQHFVMDCLNSRCSSMTLYNLIMLTGTRQGVAGDFRRKDGDNAIINRIADFL